MRVLSRSSLTFHLVLGLILALGAGLISAAGAGLGWMPGLVVLAAYLLLALRKPLRRWRATSKPLPTQTQDWLRKHVAVYRKLDAPGKSRFDRDIQVILDEWIFESVDDLEVTTEMKVGVAAGAALLLHGRPDWELPPRQSILFYPEHFDDDYALGGEGDFDGMAHEQGPIILSVRALEDSWAYANDGENVVLHELAHLLDYETQFADGVPSLIDPRSTVAWQELVQKEMQRIEDGRSILDSYGATEPAEFFAVAVETFFERPEMMAKRHPKLFAALEALFNLDPRTGRPPESPGAS